MVTHFVRKRNVMFFWTNPLCLGAAACEYDHMEDFLPSLSYVMWGPFLECPNNFATILNAFKSKYRKQKVV